MPVKAEPIWTRLDRLLVVTDGCWTLRLAPATGGYACVKVGGKPVRAHRLMYELVVGPIPEGLVLDHLCRNRACVNPDHLEPVTPAENVRRGVGVGSRIAEIQRGKTECPKGHPYDEQNTYINAQGWRVCRACRAALARKGYRSRMGRKACLV